MHYYQFNITDFSHATRHLSIVEKAVYRELLDLYYDKESPLINSPERLAKLICAPDNLTTVEQVLNEFFTLVDNVWINDKCDEVISEYQSRLDTASKAGKASAKARAAKRKASKEVTTVERPLNDRSTNYKLETNNQELETINQEQEENEKKKRVQFKKPNQKEVLDYMIEKGADTSLATTESDKFINYYESNGWKVGRNKMANWKSTCTNWLNRIDGFNKPEDTIPYELVAKAYNENYADKLNIGHVAGLTENRKAAISAIWNFKLFSREPLNTIDGWVRYFAFCSSIDGLTGNGDLSWVANFDTLVNMDKYAKTIEGGFK